jgi:hypothetical protein
VPQGIPLACTFFGELSVCSLNRIEILTDFALFSVFSSILSILAGPQRLEEACLVDRNDTTQRTSRVSTHAKNTDAITRSIVHPFETTEKGRNERKTGRSRLLQAVGFCTQGLTLATNRESSRFSQEEHCCDGLLS